MAMEPMDVSRVQRMVEDAGHTWRVREPMFSEREFQARLGVIQEPSPTEPEIVAETKRLMYDRELPYAYELDYLREIVKAKFPDIFITLNRWDWRDHGIIGDVRDQETCGSCVSFAVTGLVGAMAAKEHGVQNLHLSEAELHFCSSHGASCGGWWNDQALQVVKDDGVVTNDVFDYDTAFDNPPQWDGNLWRPHCRNVGDRTYVAWKISDFQAVDDHDSLPIRKTYLRTVGPLVASFDVYMDFNYYGGGVYKHTTGDYRGGHAVLVVGYDDNDESWIVRNSWGTTFGGSAHSDGTGAGYFKIGYGECNFDTYTMYGCTGTLPPRSEWLRKIIDHLILIPRYKFDPGGPVERIVNLADQVEIAAQREAIKDRAQPTRSGAHAPAGPPARDGRAGT